VGKYHLRADIYVIQQTQEYYITVKAVDNKLKRKNIFANLSDQRQL